jgi:hypothetical protein
LYNPVLGELCQIEKQHFGAVVGANVWLGCGVTIYPGTIIGCDAKINCSIPLAGYLTPKYQCSLFLVATTDKEGNPDITLKDIRSQVDINKSLVA